MYYIFHKGEDDINNTQGRKWWEFEDTEMLITMAIKHKVAIRCQYQGPKAQAKKREAWVAIVSK